MSDFHKKKKITEVKQYDFMIQGIVINILLFLSIECEGYK